MIFVILSVICSISLAHFLKSTETQKLSTINVLTVNYTIAVIVTLLMNQWNGLDLWPVFPIWFWLFSAVIGALFIANFFVFSKSVDQNGVGVTIAAMRVSLILPILISVVLYGEIMSYPKMTGIVLVFTAMALFVLARRDLKLTGISSHILLLALFLMTGIADSSMKIYEREMVQVGSEAHFLGVVFFVAMVIGCIVSFKQGHLQKINQKEIKYGSLVGIPNLLSSVFLIKALAVMDASIAYSLINLLVIAGGTAIGVIIWKDKISRKEWTGLFVSAVAIVLLSYA